MRMNHEESDRYVWDYCNGYRCAAEAEIRNPRGTGPVRARCMKTETHVDGVGLTGELAGEHVTVVDGRTWEWSGTSNDGVNCSVIEVKASMTRDERDARDARNDAAAGAQHLAVNTAADTKPRLDRDAILTDLMDLIPIDDTGRYIRLLADRLDIQACAGHMPNDPRGLLLALSNTLSDIRSAANAINNSHANGMPTWMWETTAEHLTQAAEDIDYFAHCFAGSDN